MGSGTGVTLSGIYTERFLYCMQVFTGELYDIFGLTFLWLLPETTV